ncbi:MULTISPECIES: rhomboid family intramembrane serine protease [unclassified Microbacterium]|uniref:rhomboid family intramembrane serine protease n=1 Tax=unclassified Microbacterium TaxID=2609290 RepID=UPI001604A8E3|nr:MULTISPECIES: rhomboid family intramembrane serine protease [unclassified Microbacterium]QNA91247.1 rhomboid family intramembrane serine protease [Microbacterium sp. Se63.02b]QYM64387.1 rhomboid family intramembrane serine protease [Microbacterium sp. Se5.02b]
MTTPEFTSNRENFCYRHPDRQSFVLCQRCMRTICPECQTQAPVGVICPQCMNAERKNRTPAQKKAARRWGGRGTGTMAMARSGRPVVTYALLAVTSFIGLVQLIPGMNQPITQALGFFAPYLYPNLFALPFEPWRLLTVLFVHGGFIHLALNMLALWMLGQSLEPMLGRVRFLAMYLISGLGGSVMVALLAPGSWTVGASGAIFGLLASLLIIGRHIGANVTGILVILGINFAFGLFVGGISWQAHLGGAVVGALVALIYTRTKRRDQRTWQIVLLAALVVLLLVIVAFVPPLLLLA